MSLSAEELTPTERANKYCKYMVPLAVYCTSWNIGAKPLEPGLFFSKHLYLRSLYDK